MSCYSTIYSCPLGRIKWSLSVGPVVPNVKFSIVFNSDFADQTIESCTMPLYHGSMRLCKVIGLTSFINKNVTCHFTANLANSDNTRNTKASSWVPLADSGCNWSTIFQAQQWSLDCSHNELVSCCKLATMHS